MRLSVGDLDGDRLLELMFVNETRDLQIYTVSKDLKTLSPYGERPPNLGRYRAASFFDLDDHG